MPAQQSPQRVRHSSQSNDVEAGAAPALVLPGDAPRKASFYGSSFRTEGMQKVEACIRVVL